MNRPDWNCTFCSKSLTYKHRGESFSIGDWLKCPLCGRLTRYALYWPKNDNGTYKTSFGIQICMLSNASGARWYEFNSMPNNILIEYQLKSIIEKLNL